MDCKSTFSRRRTSPISVSRDTKCSVRASSALLRIVTPTQESVVSRCLVGDDRSHGRIKDCQRAIGFRLHRAAYTTLFRRGQSPSRSCIRATWDTTMRLFRRGSDRRDESRSEGKVSICVCDALPHLLDAQDYLGFALLSLPFQRRSFHSVDPRR